jgi:hypothetical protein
MTEGSLEASINRNALIAYIAATSIPPIHRPRHCTADKNTLISELNNTPGYELAIMATTVEMPAAPIATPPAAGQPQGVNLLITSFPGLGLPRTLAVPVASDTPVCDVLHTIYARLPSNVDSTLIISTTSGKALRASDSSPISTLLPEAIATFLPLRISAKLCGGKGGFGSQLRAAGGRMSSKKNRDRQEQNGSNRNLDGRRLRTVDEAKRLAEYLTTKPEMEQREKDERRKRWEAVIDAAEATEAKIKAGKMGSNQGRLDAEYVESKELAEEKVREAVQKAMREQSLMDERTGSESSAEDHDESSDIEGEGDVSSGQEQAGPSKDTGSRTFFGWDDDDEDMSEDEEDAVPAGGCQTIDETAEESQPAGKGKGRAVEN